MAGQLARRSRKAASAVSSSPEPSANWRRRRVVGSVTGRLVADEVGVSRLDELRHSHGIHFTARSWQVVVDLFREP